MLTFCLSWAWRQIRNPIGLYSINSTNSGQLFLTLLTHCSPNSDSVPHGNSSDILASNPSILVIFVSMEWWKYDRGWRANSFALYPINTRASQMN
jgi:hypothetical protein